LPCSEISSSWRGFWRETGADKAKLRPQGTVGMDDLPIAFFVAIAINNGSRSDLPVEGQYRHADSVWLQIRGPDLLDTTSGASLNAKSDR
jgi:hypothetical protein